MKFFICFIFYSFILISGVKSQINGYGCRVNNVIYTEYLGMGHPYHPSNPLKRFYRSDGPKLFMNFNNYNGANAPTYYGYQCGVLNQFAASSTGPGQDEAVAEGGGCVISKTLDGPIEGDETYVNYNYNKTLYCGASVNNMPIDEYSPLFAFIIGGLGLVVIRKKKPIFFKIG